MRKFSRLAMGILALYLTVGLIALFIQRRLLYPLDRVAAPTFVPTVPGMERLWLNLPFGKVEAWFLRPVTRDSVGRLPAMIAAHGNVGLIDFHYRRFRVLREAGMGVLLVEYPGYGRSAGEPTQSSITETFLAAYDTLAARADVDPSRIVLYGHSLGGGAACVLAARRPAAALVLLSSFTSVRTFANRLLLPGFLILDPFDNLAVLREYPNPVLIGHGTRDFLIPYEQGVELSRAARQGRLVSYECGHSNCPPDWDAWVGEMIRFFREAGVLPR